MERPDNLTVAYPVRAYSGVQARALPCHEFRLGALGSMGSYNALVDDVQKHRPLDRHDVMHYRLERTQIVVVVKPFAVRNSCVCRLGAQIRVARPGRRWVRRLAAVENNRSVGVNRFPVLLGNSGNLGFTPIVRGRRGLSNGRQLGSGGSYWDRDRRCVLRQLSKRPARCRRPPDAFGKPRGENLRDEGEEVFTSGSHLTSSPIGNPRRVL